MLRAALVALVFASSARAEILPSFSDGRCHANATHVVVVDDKGKVLESWRGDLVPGDLLPVADMHLSLEHKVGGAFGRAKDAPEKVTGRRRVLFLLKDGPYYRGHTAGSWSAAHWVGWFDVSALWVEDGKAFSLEQHNNPGPHEMTPAGTETEHKAQVKAINDDAADRLTKARGEKNPAKRAVHLVNLLHEYPGFAPQAFAGLEWCGEDALPALRAAFKKDSLGEPVVRGLFEAMARVGKAARKDLVAAVASDASFWSSHVWHLRADRLDADQKQHYRKLLVLTSNLAAFEGLTAEEAKSLREFRDLWVKSEALSSLGKRPDGIIPRLDKILAAAK